MTWHVDATTAQRYATRQLDPVGASSVEAHLDRCGSCRSLVGTSVGASAGGDVLERSWAEITDRIDRPARSASERLAVRLGCSDATARLLAAVPRSRAAYGTSVLVSSVLAALAAQSSRDVALLVYLFVAPLGPLAATALAFGRWGDPIEPLHATAPTAALRLLLLRTAASVLPAIALTVLSIPWLLDRGWVAAAWLLPALALAAAAVALSSWVRLDVAVVGVCIVWAAVFALLRWWLSLPRVIDAVTGPVQIASVVAIAAATAVTTVRRSAYEFREV